MTLSCRTDKSKYWQAGLEFFLALEFHVPMAAGDVEKWRDRALEEVDQEGKELAKEMRRKMELEEAQKQTHDSMQRLLATFTARFEDDMHPSMSRKSWNELPGVRLKAEELCVVCQDSMLAGQWARAMHCGHKFHEECLEQWAK